VLAWSLVAGVAYGLVAGVATCLEVDFGLSRFGGYDLVPRVIALSAVRGFGVWGAALVPTLTTVVLLHRAGKLGTEVPVIPIIDPRLPFFVGAAVSLVYPLVVGTGCVAALLVWCADSGGTARSFVAALTETLVGVDVAYGAVATAVSALAVALATRFAGSAALSRRWWLLPKLFVAWVALQALDYALGSLFGPWLS
jgi:hypothetical protein